jgi:hypothetical protein
MSAWGFNKKGVAGAGGGTVDAVARATAAANADAIAANKGKIEKMFRVAGDKVKPKEEVFVETGGTMLNWVNNTAADVTVPASPTIANMEAAKLTLLSEAVGVNSRGWTEVSGDMALEFGQNYYVLETAGPAYNLSIPDALPGNWTPIEMTVENWANVNFVLPAGFSISFRPYGGAGRAYVFRNPPNPEFYLYQVPDASEQTYFSGQGIKLGDMTIQPHGRTLAITNVAEGAGAIYGAAVFDLAGEQTNCGFWIEDGPEVVVEPDGALATGSVDYNVTNNPATDLFITQIRVVAAEAYAGRLLYQVFLGGGRAPIMDKSIVVDLKAGDPVEWNFSPPYLLTAGTAITAKVVKFVSSGVLKTRPGTSGKPYRRFTQRKARFAETAMLPIGATETPTFTTWPTAEQLRHEAGTGRAGFFSFIYAGAEAGRTPGIYLNSNAGRADALPLIQPVRI